MGAEGGKSKGSVMAATGGQAASKAAVATVELTALPLVHRKFLLVIAKPPQPGGGAEKGWQTGGHMRPIGAEIPGGEGVGGLNNFNLCWDSGAPRHGLAQIYIYIWAKGWHFACP